MTASFVDLVDLASERLGAAAVAANDEFFAAKRESRQVDGARLARRRVHRAAENGWTDGRRVGAGISVPTRTTGA